MDLGSMSGWLIVLISYLVGSIPFAYIIARLRRGLDLWEVGEGNIGARNVWHVVSPTWGVVAGVLDASKGASIAVLVSAFPEVSPWICGAAVVIGHQFPIFLKGKGGKGAATLMGFLFVLYPLQVLLSGFLFLIVSLITGNFHMAIGLTMALIPLLWLPLWGFPFSQSLLTIGLMSILGVKRLIDDRHMREVRRRGLFWTL